jgi:hypothetical protein
MPSSLSQFHLMAHLLLLLAVLQKLPEVVDSRRGNSSRQEAPAPPSSTASPSLCAVGEHPSYPPCPVAHTYYHSSHREDVALIWSSEGRYASHRCGHADRAHRAYHAHRANTVWAKSTFWLGLPSHLWPVQPSRPRGPLGRGLGPESARCVV